MPYPTVVGVLRAAPVFCIVSVLKAMDARTITETETSQVCRVATKESYGVR